MAESLDGTLDKYVCDEVTHLNEKGDIFDSILDIHEEVRQKEEVVEEKVEVKKKLKKKKRVKLKAKPKLNTRDDFDIF